MTHMITYSSTSTKDSPDAGFKPSREEEMKGAEDPGNEGGIPKDNVVNENIVYGCSDDLNIPDLKEIGRFSDVKNDDLGADINNLDTYFQVSPVPTTRILNDIPLNQVIGDLQSATQTRQMTKNLEEYGFVSTTLKQRTSHKDLQNCLFSCLLSQEEPQKVVQALKDPSWIEAMQEELLQFKLQEVWNFWFQRGQIDKNLFIRRDKGDILLVQVYVDDIIFGFAKKSLCTEFEKIMHKKFQMSSMSELTFFLGLKVKQKEDGIFISQDKSMIGSLMYLTSSRPDIIFAVCACARYQDNPKVSHLHAVKRIFRYLKGQPKLDLWYPKDSPFDLVAYTDSDYARASLDRKSTTGGCQFLGCRLISWQCKKHAMVVNSTIEAEYVAASSCCGPILWIQNQLLDFGDSNEKKLIQMIKIHTDKNVADLLTKAFDVNWNGKAVKDEFRNGSRVNTGDSKLMILGINLLLLEKVNAARHALTTVVEIVFLDKPAESEGFEQIVDFLNASSIRHALTVNSTIYTSCIQQFWATVKMKTVNGEVQLQALVDKKKIIITESTIRRDLQLEDAE
ncbi:putative ribonuclease H-like domain-containing protein, partial [Tanacetum coccineum]